MTFAAHTAAVVVAETADDDGGGAADGVAAETDAAEGGVDLNYEHYWVPRLQITKPIDGFF